MCHSRLDLESSVYFGYSGIIGKMNNSIKKFSIVLSGGGMRCAWSGGFLVALSDMGFQPASIITKSGNAGNAVYVATGQTEMIKRIWTIHLARSKFINWWRFWKIIDIDYLVDEVLSHYEPVDLKRLKKSSTRVFVACFNVSQRRVDYFSNEVIDFSVLKATKAMPIAYGKEINIRGDMYTDKPFSPYQLLEDQNKNLEQKILLIDVREKSSLIRKLYTIVGDKTKVEERLAENIFVIEPKNTRVRLLSGSSAVLREAYDDGYTCALSRKGDILEFLK